MDNRNSGSDSNNFANSLSKLGIGIFVLLYLADTILSTIGLVTGNYLHYNQIGIFVYETFTIFGFWFYRLFSLYLLYLVFKWIKNYKKTKLFLMGVAVYIYICAIVWDLYTLGYPQVYYAIPEWFRGLNEGALYLVFHLIGVI